MAERLHSSEKGLVSSLRAGAIARVSARRNVRRVLLATSIILFLLFVSLHQQRRTQDIEQKVLRYFSLTNAEQARLHDSRLASLQAGLKQCALLQETPIAEYDEARTNPRAIPSSQPIVIRNATLIDGDGSTKEGCSILLSGGVFTKIDGRIEVPEHAKVIDVGGRYVTPGLVDMVHI